MTDFVCDISCLESLTMVEEQKRVTCSTNSNLKSNSVRSESNNVRMMRYKGMHKLRALEETSVKCRT